MEGSTPAQQRLGLLDHLDDITVGILGEAGDDIPKIWQRIWLARHFQTRSLDHGSQGLGVVDVEHQLDRVVGVMLIRAIDLVHQQYRAFTVIAGKDLLHMRQVEGLHLLHPMTLV